MKQDKPKGLKISQLAELADVTVPTVSHYLKKGLLPQPVKTGRTMAWYDPSCVERIKLIKKLQHEQYLPLDIIKRIIDSGELLEEESHIGRQIAKSEWGAEDEKSIKQSELAEQTGWPIRKIRLLEREGLLHPARGSTGKKYDQLDRNIIEICRDREDIGLPFDLTLDVFKRYMETLESVVDLETRSRLNHLIEEDASEEYLKLIEKSDETLDRLVLVLRRKIVRRTNLRLLQDIDETQDRLAGMLTPPSAGEYLPEKPPTDSALKLFYYFCQARFDYILDSFTPDHNDRILTAGLVLTFFFNGDWEGAYRLTRKYLPDPATESWINAVAALALLLTATQKTGFNQLLKLSRQAMSYLRTSEQKANSSSIADCLFRYICGHIYFALPEMQNKHLTGLHMLTDLAELLDGGRMNLKKTPAWVRKTLQYEIFPAVLNNIESIKTAYKDSGQGREA